MKTEFKDSFTRDLKKIRDPHVLEQVRSAILAVEGAASLQSVPNLKKLSGSGPYFRIRTGEYRIGLRVDEDTVSFIRVLLRKEIYRLFPCAPAVAVVHIIEQDVNRIAAAGLRLGTERRSRPNLYFLVGRTAPARRRAPGCSGDGRRAALTQSGSTFGPNARLAASFACRAGRASLPRVILPFT